MQQTVKNVVTYTGSTVAVVTLACFAGAMLSPSGTAASALFAKGLFWSLIAFSVSTPGMIMAMAQETDEEFSGVFDPESFEIPHGEAEPVEAKAVEENPFS